MANSMPSTTTQAPGPILATWRCEEFQLKVILLIDDDIDHGEAVLHALQFAGYVTHFAQCGNAGLVEAELHQPQLIILDFHLPDILGTDVAKVIRSGSGRLRDTKILMNSSHPVSVIREQFTDYDHFLQKPFDHADLLAVVADLTCAA
jgi:DNA-binding response OmpR family regulator